MQTSENPVLCASIFIALSPIFGLLGAIPAGIFFGQAELGFFIITGFCVFFGLLAVIGALTETEQTSQE